LPAQACFFYFPIELYSVFIKMPVASGLYLLRKAALNQGYLMLFTELELSEQLLQAVADQGYQTQLFYRGVMCWLVRKRAQEKPPGLPCHY
jgi:hypothetical protein